MSPRPKSKQQHRNTHHSRSPAHTTAKIVRSALASGSKRRRGAGQWARTAGTHISTAGMWRRRLSPMHYGAPLGDRATQQLACRHPAYTALPHLRPSEYHAAQANCPPPLRAQPHWGSAHWTAATLRQQHYFKQHCPTFDSKTTLLCPITPHRPRANLPKTIP
jgi:hypothetical protein